MIPTNGAADVLTAAFPLAVTQPFLRYTTLSMACACNRQALVTTAAQNLKLLRHYDRLAQLTTTKPKNAVDSAASSLPRAPPYIAPKKMQLAAANVCSGFVVANSCERKKRLGQEYSCNNVDNFFKSSVSNDLPESPVRPV